MFLLFIEIVDILLQSRLPPSPPFPVGVTIISVILIVEHACVLQWFCLVFCRLGGEWTSECWQGMLQEVNELESRTAPNPSSSNWKLHHEEDTLLPGSSSDSGIGHSGNVTPASAAVVARDRHLSIESMQSASDSGIAGLFYTQPQMFS
jgi:hypothetical protein